MVNRKKIKVQTTIKTTIHRNIWGFLVEIFTDTDLSPTFSLWVNLI
jgi:hypothetical protein